MTLKYMWMPGLIDETKNERPEVPLDSIVMKTASEDSRGHKEPVDFPVDNEAESTRRRKYSESGSMPWSKLNAGEYREIQEKMQTLAPENGSLIGWECSAWIRGAEQKKTS